MKIKILLAAAALTGALATPALAGDPTGLWQTPTNGGQVRIARCGQALGSATVPSEAAAPAGVMASAAPARKCSPHRSEGRGSALL